MFGMVRVGMGVLWDCWGEWGLEDTRMIQLRLIVCSIYSTMLKIRNVYRMPNGFHEICKFMWCP